MKIQYLRRYVEKDKYKILEQNSILQPIVLDDFDINIIDLSDPKIWISGDSKEIECLKDLKNIFKLGRVLKLKIGNIFNNYESIY